MFRHLQKANVSEKEFKSCWFYLHPRLSDDELFSLFKDSGFSHGEITGRSAFVRTVLQRCKDIKVFCQNLYLYFYVYLHRLRTHAFACLCIASACLYGPYGHLYDPQLQENYRSRTHIKAQHPHMLLVILNTISRTRNHHL